MVLRLVLVSKSSCGRIAENIPPASNLGRLSGKFLDGALCLSGTALPCQAARWDPGSPHRLLAVHLCSSRRATGKARSSAPHPRFAKLCPSVLLVAMITPIRCSKNLKDSPSIVIVPEQIRDIYWKRKDVGYFVAWYFFIQKHHFCRQLHCASRTNFSEQLIKFIINELWLPQC